MGVARAMEESCETHMNGYSHPRAACIHALFLRSANLTESHPRPEAPSTRSTLNLQDGTIFRRLTQLMDKICLQQRRVECKTQ